MSFKDTIKSPNERAVYKSTSKELFDKVKQEALKENPQNIKLINEGKTIGILTIKKNEEIVNKRIYAISMVVDNDDKTFIFDEEGEPIAVIHNKNEKTIEEAERTQFDHETLIRTMNNVNSSQNDNEGRHIADKQEKLIPEKQKPQQKKEALEDSKNGVIEESNKITNLVDKGVSINKEAAIIDIYRTIYNGRRLRDVLSINEKLKDKVPTNIGIDNLNYLGIVNTADLPENGNKRDSDITCVIMDDPINPKNMIELDSSILKPREKLSKQENRKADKTSNYFKDDGRDTAAQENTRARQIATFEIVGAGANISQSKDLMTLEVRYNSKYIEEGKSQKDDAHNIEFYLGVQRRAQTENEQKHGYRTQAVKIEAYDEVRSVREIFQRRAFENQTGKDTFQPHKINTLAVEKIIHERKSKEEIDKCFTEKNLRFQIMTLLMRHKELSNEEIADIVVDIIDERIRFKSEENGEKSKDDGQKAIWDSNPRIIRGKR